MKKNLTKRNSTKNQRRFQNVVETARDMVATNPAVKQQLMRAMDNVVGKRNTRRVRNIAALVGAAAPQVNRRRRRRSRGSGGDPADGYAKHLIAGALPNRPKMGIPFFNIAPSVKARFKSNVRVDVGSNGLGWFAFEPVTCNSGAFCASYTQSPAFIGSNFDTSAAGVINLAPNSLPYSDVDIMVNRDIQARVVSMGIKMYYQGKLIDRSGTYFLYRDPANDPIAFSGSTLSPADISQRRDCAITPVDGSEQCLSALPIDSDMLEYTTDTCVPWVGGDGAANKFSNIIAIYGTSGTSFRVEVCLDVEYLGAQTEGIGSVNKVSSKPPSHTITKAQQYHRRLMAGLHTVEELGGILGGVYTMGTEAVEAFA